MEPTSQLPKPSSPPRKVSPGHLWFLRFLTVVAICYAVILGYHLLVPAPSKAANRLTLLELCRQKCLKLGLVPTGHIANDAKAYLQFVNPSPLDGSTFEVLTDPDYQPDPSQAHPLLGKSPPDFELRDDRGQPHKLSEYLDNGPLVLVFYFGYNCNHCVGQLFGLNRDINRFRELGTQVVAISADSPEETAKRFKEYGQFDFPVLSDPGNKVAAAYGVYQPAKEKTVEKLLHGTFVIDSERQVVWCNAGDEPYFHNMTLLHQLAKAQGVLPPPRKKEAHE